MIFLNQHFHHQQVSAGQMDRLWEEGWRHFGSEFFRYSVATHEGKFFSVIPLRIDLNLFEHSKSQKRAIVRNSDVEVTVRESFVDSIKEDLFYRHRDRFTHNIPDSIFDFLSPQPASIPCPNHEICVYDGDRLIAASFLDIGESSTSAVYAMFDPDESKRSLGIFTMLEAIRYSRELGCRYYYPGYAYREPSVYDYKKKFSALEYLEWGEGWKRFSKITGESENDQS